ncbi:MAG: transglycosylase domain-containing protein [Pseudomonadales bacterium]
MAAKRAATTRYGRRRARRRAKPAPRWRLLRRLVAGLAVIGTLGIAAVGGYLFYLDRTITWTFEGRRWTVPAVIYAQPLELYPGASTTAAAVTRELERLGYELKANASSPGTYQRAGNRLEIHLRSFRFMEGLRANQRIEILFDSGVAQIRDQNGRPVPLVRLEPIPIGSFFPSHGEDRLVLAPEQIPPLLRDALKAVEDQNYDRHVGFDPAGIARAMWVNVRAGERQQGGSTITQQLVKSYYLDNRRTFERKLRELAMAVILDARFDKEDILDAYINEIYLGQDGNRAIHGFGLGSQYYFNRPLTELDADEIATLIAIIRGPSYYNPYRNGERALARRDLVLDKMRESGLITAQVHEQGRGMPLKVVRGNRSGGGYYPAFMDLVRQELSQHYQDVDLTTTGLRIFTTLQPNVQDAVEAALTGTLTRLERDRKLPEQSLQGAVVVTANQTGEVLAIAGGRDAGFHGFNRALHARRPIGSLVKPVVYLTALEQGYHMASMINDAPVHLEESGKSWMPRNFDRKVNGPVPMVRALGDSLNLATVNLGLTLGIEQVATRLGSLTGIAPRNRYPSLLLGAEAMSPLQVAGLYGTFASGGFYMPHKAVIAVLDEAGMPVSRHSLQLEQKIAAEHAQALSRSLESVMRRGTGANSRFARAGTAGKTGTSDDYRDSWFAGYDDVHLSVVWVGMDDNTPTGLSGSSGALKVWDEIMMHLGVQPLLHRGGDNLRSIEYGTGLLAHGGCADVEQVYVPEGAPLRAKPGCGINAPSLTDRLRSWLGKD